MMEPKLNPMDKATLKQLGEAYREASSALPAAEPPQALDEAIRAAARRAVSSKPIAFKKT